MLNTLLLATTIWIGPAAEDMSQRVQDSVQDLQKSFSKDKSWEIVQDLADAEVYVKVLNSGMEPNGKYMVQSISNGIQTFVDVKQGAARTITALTNAEGCDVMVGGQSMTSWGRAAGALKKNLEQCSDEE